MLKAKVLVSTSSFAQSDSAPMDMLRKEGFEVELNPHGRKLTKKEIIGLLPGVTGLIAGLETLDREVMEQSILKVISRCGAGLSNVDLEAAKELGIKVCATPFGPTTSVAELTIGAMICLLRQLPQMNADLHGGAWAKRTGLELQGKTVVIIGYGRIGKKLALLLRPFNVKIIVVDPFYGKTGDPGDNIELLPLEQALPRADIISIHSSGEGRIISGKEFSLLKDGVFLLNAARGGAIDDQALIKALENGKISGAWIDTFDNEPYSGQLRNYPQVILTPHAGSYTLECRRSMEMEAALNLINAFKESKNDD